MFYLFILDTTHHLNLVGVKNIPTISQTIFFQLLRPQNFKLDCILIYQVQLKYH